MAASRADRRRNANRARRNFNLRSLQGLERLEERAVPATFTVTSLNDSGTDTLRWAIDQAAGSAGADIIEFDASLAAQTIVLSTAADATNWGNTALVIINDDVTIDGSSAPGLTISGNDAFRILGVGIGADVTLTNLNLTKGYAKGGNGAAGAWPGGGGGGADMGGAVFNNNGTVSIINSTLAGNQAVGGPGLSGGGPGEGLGGAVFNYEGTLSILNTTLFGNRGEGRSSSSMVWNGGNALGGAVFGYEGSVSITNSTLTANEAVGGTSASTLAGQGLGGAVATLNSGLEILNSTIASVLSRKSAG